MQEERLELINALRISVSHLIEIPPATQINHHIDNRDKPIPTKRLLRKSPKQENKVFTHNIERETLNFTKELSQKTLISNLSALLSKTEIDNPLIIYDKFSGKNDRNSIQVQILFPFCDSSIKICVQKQATVNDLIGYALYEFTKDNNDSKIPKTLRDPLEWNLRIADDGEIDEDFPVLERTRQIQKYQFGEFALVPIKPIAENSDEVRVSHSPAKEEQVFLKIHLYSTLEVKQTTMMHMPLHLTMKEVFERICEKRKYNQKDYILKMADTKTDVPLEKTLAQLECIEFCVLKRASGGAGDIFLRPPDEEYSESATIDLSAEDPRTMFKQFNVVSRSLMAKQDRILIIDGEYLHVDYPEGKRKKGATSYSISEISSCRLSKKSSNIVKLSIQKGNDIRNYEFEASTHAIASIFHLQDEICLRIEYILKNAKKM